MVQPLARLAFSSGLALVAVLAAADARAEPLGFSCGPGVVVGVEGGDDVVRALCEAARSKLTRGDLRIGAVGVGGARFRITATYVADASGVERASRREVTGIEGVRRVAAAMLEELLSPGAPPAASLPTLEPAPSPAPEKIPADRATPEHGAPPEPPLASGRQADAVDAPQAITEAKPRPRPRRTTFPLGAVGVVVAPFRAGVSARSMPTLFGGGATLGVDHDRVHTYAELAFTRGSSGPLDVAQTQLALAARGRILASRITPVLGGGFLFASTRYTSSTDFSGSSRTDAVDTKFHLFGEAGASLQITDEHRLVLVGRVTPLSAQKLATADLAYLYAF